LPAQSKTKRSRIDQLLVERGLAETRQRAQAMILAGEVFVRGQRIAKPGTMVAPDAPLEIVGATLRYASRGGLKLEGALEDFRIDPAGKICLDVGSSTGGFTDCLVQHGANRVYAVDVNTNQLAWKLQQDARVILVKRNARYLRPEDIGELADLATVDVSFISVKLVLPAVAKLLKPGAELLVLVKPQFELDRTDVRRGGVVTDPALHQRAIERGKAAAESAGLRVVQAVPSRLPGAEGNLEFFLHARRSALE
jgi:23S rRNA (cytidine1920-2'-O)/16S rRNA (cytidine1409-2'-O)-methyltransferase